MSKTAYFNGEIITVNPHNDVADAILIENGRILAVGGREEVLALADGETRRVDLKGKAVLPGFIDPHGHIVAVAQGLLLLDLSGCASERELLERLRDKLERDPPRNGGWLIGFGYDNTRFPGQQHPTKFALDSVSARVPIFLSHASGHLAAANTAALERLRTAKQRLADAPICAEETPGERSFLAGLPQVRKAFCAAMDDDLNTADALGVIFDFARSCNAFVSTPQRQAAVDAAKGLFQELTGVLGLLQRDAEEAFPAQALALLEARTQARKNRDFARADAIREELKSMGYAVEDGKDGAKLKGI